MAKRKNTPVASMSVSSSPQLHDYERALLERVRSRLPAFAQQLQAAGVVMLEIRYDGCGDSGAVEEIAGFDVHQQAVDLAQVTGLDELTLKDLFYDLSQVRHPGWQNGEGAWGEFVWKLASAALLQVHHDRFIDYDTTEHEGL